MANETQGNSERASQFALLSASTPDLPISRLESSREEVGESTSTTAPPTGTGSCSSAQGILNLSALRDRISQFKASKKSAGSRSSVSSLPVIVRSYPTLRHHSYAAYRAGASSGGRTMDPLPSLPPVAEFSFSHILQTVDAEIQEPLEAISAICARSRYSLADEYTAHLPPQGEIRGSTFHYHYPFSHRHGLFIRTTALADSALSVVQEASSSSAASDTGTMQSAYGSLRNVLSRRTTDQIRNEGDATGDEDGQQGHIWAVQKEGKQSIVLVSEPQPSFQVLTAAVTEADPIDTTQRDNSHAHSSWLLLNRLNSLLPWSIWRTRPEPQSSAAESILRNILNTGTQSYG